MTELGIGMCIGFIAGIICTLLTAAVVAAIGNDHEYLDYPPEEMEWDKRWRDGED